jgi:hypothetical protein
MPPAQDTQDCSTVPPATSSLADSLQFTGYQHEEEKKEKKKNIKKNIKKKRTILTGKVQAFHITHIPRQ